MAVPRLLAAAGLALAAGRGASAGAVGTDPGRGRRGLSRFSLPELQAASPAARARLRRVLRGEGALLLTDIPGYRDSAAEALDALGDCFDRLEASSASSWGRAAASAGSARPVASPALLRGGLERWTLATSTRAGSPDPLPDWAAGACPALLGPAERLRSFVSLVLIHFAHSADAAAALELEAEPEALGALGARRGAGFLQALEPTEEGAQGAALEDLLRRGTLLEHFHRYRRSAGPEAASRRPLGMHTDAGLLQALSVRWRALPGSAAAGTAAVGLEVELPGGLVVAAEEEVASGVRPEDGGEKAGGLLLLLGQASQEWLPHLRLRAAPHALAAAPPGSGEGSDAGRHVERLVYGVMVLPPEDWPIVAPGAGNATFGEWWRRAQRAVGGAPGRPSPEATEDREEEEEERGDGCLSADLLQRRLRDQAQTCPAGSIYCWMQCQRVPSDLPCKAERAVCMSSTTKRVCPEDSSHDASCKPACPAGGRFSFEIAGAGEAEVNGGYRTNGWIGSKRSYVKPSVVDGATRAQVVWDDYWASEHFGQWVVFIPGYRNGSALYYSDSDEESPPRSAWHAAIGALPLPTLDFNHSNDSVPDVLGQGFCNGVLTDMNMLGFTVASEDNPCLIFLFRGWELTSTARFALAAAATVAAGIFAEWLVALRRWEAKRYPIPKAVPGHFSMWRAWRQLCSLALYALTRCMGYLVMLITMTYSTELFVAVVLGLTMGHALFNAAASPGEDISLCCQASSPAAGRRMVEVADARLIPLRFQVTGMTCESCCGTVRRAVESVGSVRSVRELSVATGKLEVLVADAGTGVAGAGGVGREAERIEQAVEDVGFGARLVGAEVPGGIGGSGCQLAAERVASSGTARSEVARWMACPARCRRLLRALIS